MKIYTPTRLTPHITEIRDVTGVSAYLVVGDEKAVLIDTCTGIKGLKELVEGLTDKPVTVLLTHSHGDHSGSVADFETVYIHPDDLKFLTGAAQGAGGIGMRLGFANGNVPGAPFTESDLVADPPADKEYKLLSDGMTFDLGGISVETIHVPGHTAGSCTFLFPEERSMLYGDALNSNTLLACRESVTIEAYQKGLQHLKTYEDRYDTAYYSHGPAIGPKSCLEDNLDLCEKILDGTDFAEEQPFMGGGTACLAAEREGFMERKDGRFGNIVYDRERIR